jgi:hypothetical protein
MAAVTYSNADENQFWLQIMGDNARLLLTALNPDEVKIAKQLHGFIDQFDNLLTQAEKNMPPEQMAKFNQEAYSATQNIREYFLYILKMQVARGFFILLKPPL